MIKICAVSDLHGNLIGIDPCDLLLICGDSVSLGMQRYDESTEEWYVNNFKPWAENLPVNKVLWIAGNHDYMEGRAGIYRSIFPRLDKVTYLEDDLFIYQKGEESLRIYGTPWCKRFGRWHFMANPEKLEEIYSNIPENLDILMTHDRPYGVGDVLLDKECYWWSPDHIGNPELAEAILKKKPKYNLGGHLHSTSHEFETIGETKTRCVSILGEDYKVRYEPLYMEL